MGDNEPNLSGLRRTIASAADAPCALIGTLSSELRTAFRGSVPGSVFRAAPSSVAVNDGETG